MSMGQGSLYNTSAKQKINTKSSTETEVVSTDDCMPQMMWTKYFLEGQDYVCRHELQQDNTSAMRLEINGKASSGKRTKHMDVRYFFIKDRVDAGDLTIHHCPTADMVGDFFTKPLQGAAFIRFKNLIMGNVPHDFSANTIKQAFDTATPRSVLGDVPRSGKPKNGSGTEGLEEAQPGEKPLGAAMRKIGAEEGWTLVKRSRTDKVERTRSIGPH